MTAKSKSICAVCSLLCPLAEPPMLDPSRGHAGSRSCVADCSRRNRWIDLRTGANSVNTLLHASLDQAAIGLLKQARRPLIWIDGADVETVRSAVELSKVWYATIHAAQSTGSKVVSRVTCADGWFGTTLADAARHSQLLITLGTRWTQSMPLLVDRFFGQRQDLQWWSIQADDKADDQGTNALSWAMQQPLKPSRQVVWPRGRWNTKLSQLAQQVQSTDCPPKFDSLAAAILQSSSTTILWDKSEIQSDADETLVLLLHQLAKCRSTNARLSLLPINSNPGNETSQAALLWLTGCASTARPTSDDWVSPSHYQHYSLADWRAEFDCILAIRNTPSTKPVTISADLLLCPPSDSTPAPLLNVLTKAIPVGTAGVDHDALFIRGDHGMTCFAPATVSATEVKLPTASQLLRQAAVILNDFKRGLA